MPSSGGGARMSPYLDLQLTNATGRGRLGPLLVAVEDIESVRPAYHRVEVIGSLIRTRSGETHCVVERVNVIRKLMLQIMEGLES
ncbi:MAG: hypothetical protein CK431_04420 [Mycobacterium sp.]|nr:MAG: hypothetical protein CK431_04420 [Mycobacterium sp.]